MNCYAFQFFWSLYEVSHAFVSEPDQMERMKLFELSKFQTFVNKCFKTTLIITIQLVVHSNWQRFVDAKEFSNIKSENEMTDKDV